jgi:NTE family protein
LTEALADETLTSRKLVGRAIQGYLNRDEHPFLHLVDGGIADNLGLRTFYEAVHMHGGDPIVAFREMNHLNVRHVLIISINAHAQRKKQWALERDVPSLSEVIQSVSADQIQRYSVDTIELVRRSFERWTRGASTPEHPLSFEFVEVSFEAVHDPKVRESLNEIGTNFHLRDEEVDQLISVARKVLRDSKEFQAFLARTGGRSTAPEPTTAAASTPSTP